MFHRGTVHRATVLDDAGFVVLAIVALEEIRALRDERPATLAAKALHFALPQPGQTFDAAVSNLYPTEITDVMRPAPIARLSLGRIARMYWW